MELQYIKRIGTWRDVADEARTTIGMTEGVGEPKDSWKRKMLLCEHSPIRLLHYKWKWLDIPYCYSVHFVRHKYGIEHWVKTSRSDRTGIDRHTLPQDNPVNHTCEATAQAIINISRKRLCNCASKETREAWKLVLQGLHEIEPCLTDVCVPECVYRGFCTEYKSCGYTNTPQFEIALAEYRNSVKVIN